MREEDKYLSEQELERIIAEAEREMLVAPDYLEQMILKETKKYELRAQKSITQTGNSRFFQLFSYSLKTVVAAAAALAFVFTIPFMEDRMEASFREGKEISVQREISEKRDMERPDARSLNEKTSDFCTRLFERTNELLFQREEKR